MVTRPRQTFFAILVLASTSGFVPSVYGQPPYSTAAWQKEMATGYLPYRRLVPGDFPIDDRAHRENGIYTAGFFHYTYIHYCIAGLGPVVVRVTDWVVRSGFDRNKSSRKSWFRSAEKFLEHEQGHLDINELHSRMLGNISLSDLPQGEGKTCQEAETDLEEKLSLLAARYSREAQAEQDRYDMETGHGNNEAKQREATATIKTRLKKAGITYAHR